MKYLVTGATGFVGRYLVKSLLQGGHEVASMVRRGGTAPEGTREYVADLLDEASVNDAVSAFVPNGIFHLAAAETSPRRSLETPAETVRGNVTTTLSVLDAARRLGKPPRILFVSSILLEQKTPSENPYVLSKRFGEELCALYAAAYRLPSVIVRPTNHTGVGQSADFAVPNFARQTAEIETGRRSAYAVGDVSATRDFLDVRDVVCAYLLLMAKGEPDKTYLVASGRRVRMREILAYLAAQSTATIPSVPGAEAPVATTEPTDLDATPLRNLGWKPEIDIEQTWRELLTEARAAVTKGTT